MRPAKTPLRTGYFPSMSPDRREPIAVLCTNNGKGWLFNAGLPCQPRMQLVPMDVMIYGTAERALLAARRRWNRRQGSARWGSGSPL